MDRGKRNILGVILAAVATVLCVAFDELAKAAPLELDSSDTQDNTPNQEESEE